MIGAKWCSDVRRPDHASSAALRARGDRRTWRNWREHRQEYIPTGALGHRRGARRRRPTPGARCRPSPQRSCDYATRSASYVRSRSRSLLGLPSRSRANQLSAISYRLSAIKRDGSRRTAPRPVGPASVKGVRIGRIGQNRADDAGRSIPISFGHCESDSPSRGAIRPVRPLRPIRIP
ncbi:MAG: hypothetical protein K0S86_5717, partial [Geminicoccaceae bacterium]|nr:hypothetical protein [Geminicoccaceae bacterium]